MCPVQFRVRVERWFQDRAGERWPLVQLLALRSAGMPWAAADASMVSPLGMPDEMVSKWRLAGIEARTAAMETGWVPVGHPDRPDDDE